MKDNVREILAKKAYETNVGIKGEVSSEQYFKRDYYTWDELPESSRACWKNVIFAIFRELDSINCGEL